MSRTPVGFRGRGKSPAQNSSRSPPRLVAPLVLCFLVIGCANTRPLDPDAGPVALAENEGILVIHIRTQVKVASIRVAGAAPPEIATDLPVGEHLWLLAATKGDYRWRRIEFYIYPITWYWNLRSSDESLHFTVQAGKINYPGVLEIDGSEGRIRDISLRTFNRSAIMFANLQRRYPALLERFPMRYAGSRRDDFLDYYLEASRAIRSEQVSAP
jgi:hypothetical protein